MRPRARRPASPPERPLVIVRSVCGPGAARAPDRFVCAGRRRTLVPAPRSWRLARTAVPTLPMGLPSEQQHEYTECIVKQIRYVFTVHSQYCTVFCTISEQNAHALLEFVSADFCERLVFRRREFHVPAALFRIAFGGSQLSLVVRLRENSQLLHFAQLSALRAAAANATRRYCFWTN